MCKTKTVSTAKLPLPSPPHKHKKHNHPPSIPHSIYDTIATLKKPAGPEMWDPLVMLLRPLWRPALISCAIGL